MEAMVDGKLLSKQGIKDFDATANCIFMTTGKKTIFVDFSLENGEVISAKVNRNGDEPEN